MSVSRRTLLRSLTVGSLGGAALTGCTGGRRGRSRKTTAPPSASDAPDPEKPLKIGLIGTKIGLEALYDEGIRLAVGEAVTDANAYGTGTFGHDIVLLPPLEVEDEKTKVADLLEKLAKDGAQAVILNVPDELLVPAIPAIVSTNLLALSVTSRAMDARTADVNASGLLFRLAPSDLAIGTQYVKTAVEEADGGDRSGVPGRVAYIATDTMQGTSLRDVLASQLRRKGGEIAVDDRHPIGHPGDIEKLAKKVVAKKPALVVIDRAEESGPIAAAIYRASLDKDGRPKIDIPIRLGPYGSADYSEIVEKAEALSSTTGFHPGGELSTEHVNEMLNVSPSMVDFSFTQQAYDALVIIALAAQEAHSLDGTRIAEQIPAVLSGQTECGSYEDCQEFLTDKSTPQYAARMGKIEFAADGDLRTGENRTFAYTDANGPDKVNVENFDISP